jgi:anti-sigma factor RsiW
MNHPYELLADLTDRTLDEGDLARVQAHLDTCPSCREDVAFATAGRDAARSLPQATAPAELHQRVVAAAGGRGSDVPSWYRWAGVAAAAAVVVAITIALPNVGGEGTDRGSSEEAGGQIAVGAGAEDAASGRQVEIQDRNYDANALEQLASAAASDSAAQVEANASQVTLVADPTAATCVNRAFDERPVGRLARLIEARFEGRAAYIAVYLEGPGANEPPDTAAVWVAAKEDCSILSFASARI